MNRLNRASINMLSGAGGYIVPMFVNLISIPLLLRGLGESAFGLQSLVAVIIGYLTIMDMGLAWPITKYLAEDRAKNDDESANRMLSTTLNLYGMIGIVGMVVIFLSAGWLARSVFKMPAELIPQATMVFRLASIGFLGSVGISWGQALSMGLQRYEISGGILIVSNIVGVGLGLVMVYAGHGVVSYVLVRVIVSLASGPVYWLLARRLLPTFRIKWGIDIATLRRIRGYVGYGAINRVVSGLMSRLDQTLIGIWLGVAAAGIYSVPFLVVNSLGYMISAMLGFIFPMLNHFFNTLPQIVNSTDFSLRQISPISEEERVIDNFGLKIRVSLFIFVFKLPPYIPRQEIQGERGVNDSKRDKGKSTIDYIQESDYHPLETWFVKRNPISHSSS